VCLFRFDYLVRDLSVEKIPLPSQRREAGLNENYIPLPIDRERAARIVDFVMV